MNKNNYNRPIIVGIFIFLGLFILVLAIFTLGGQKKTFVKTVTINAIFDDVSGLQSGANIWFSGVKVGTVKKIGFYGDSQVQITMDIERTAQKHIHKDAKVKIGSDGLIGNKIIQIYGGNLVNPQVEKNDFLTVENAASTEDMFATLQENNKNLLEITKDFKRFSKKIDSGQGLLGKLLNDPKMAQKLDFSVDNLNKTLANLKTASEGSKSIVSNIENFTYKLNKKGNSLHEIVNDTTAYKSIMGSLVQLNIATNSVSKFSENLKTLSQKFDDKDNTLGLLLNDAKTANSLKITLKNLESSSKKLDEDLEALQHNFLLKGFFKKKAKSENKQGTF